MAGQPTEPPPSDTSVVVLGGGVAGISAALYLSEAGFKVTLVESRRFLGGRAFSFTDGKTGDVVDNGQHVITGGCTRFLDLLERLGARDRWFLQPRLHIKVRSRQGTEGALRAGLAPAPFHLLGSLLRFPHLPAADKFRVLAALVRAKLTDRSQPGLERITFRDWLVERGQTERAIAKFWNVFVEPVLNDSVSDVSAAMGLMFVQEAMLKGYEDPNIGYPTGGLLPCLGEPARERLSGLGCNVMLGAPVKRIVVEAGIDSLRHVSAALPGDGSTGGVMPGAGQRREGARVAGVELGSGEMVTGDRYVSALPWDVLGMVLPDETAGMPVFSRSGKIQQAPIVNVHLWYDRPVMEEDFCAFVDSPLQWVFNKGAASGRSGPERAHPAGKGAAGQRICVSLSAAWEHIDLPREELAQAIHAEVLAAFSHKGARQKGGPPNLLHRSVVKQRNATIRCLPGVEELRPPSATLIPNLFLAGDWTKTGWPSTLEGAARSGFNAAQAVAASLGATPDPVRRTEG